MRIVAALARCAFVELSIVGISFEASIIERRSCSSVITVHQVYHLNISHLFGYSAVCLSHCLSDKPAAGED
jgi:hypothetical protein